MLPIRRKIPEDMSFVILEREDYEHNPCHHCDIMTDCLPDKPCAKKVTYLKNKRITL
jgi:hypothetical protein